MRIAKTIIAAGLTTGLLAGCANYSYVFAIDEGCGEITPVDETPDLFMNYDVSGDVPRMETDLAWNVTPPQDFRVGSLGGSDTSDVVRSFATHSLPLAWLVEEFARQTEEYDLAANGFEKFVLSLSDSELTNASLNASNEFLAQLSVPATFAFDAEYYGDQFLAPILTSTLHLPVNLVATCGYSIEEFDAGFERDFIFNDGDSFYELPNSTAREIYPGYAPGTTLFASTPDSISIESSIDDGRIPAFVNVVPWFGGLADSVQDEGGDPWDFEALTDFEQFWTSQIMFYEMSGIGEDSINATTFYNDENMRSEIYAHLDEPLDQSHFEQLYLDAAIADWENWPDPDQDGIDDPMPTLESLGLGEMKYLFVYSIFTREVSDGRIQVYYSFEKYYPGVEGEIVTLDVFEEQQAELAAASTYDGPVISSVTPNPATAGEIVTFAGDKLSEIKSLVVDSKKLEIISQTETQIKAKLPQEITSGLKDLKVESSSGTLVAQDLFTVSDGLITTQQIDTSITLKDNGVARLLAKNLVGVGKVQFKLNGKEVAWVNAVDASDPKLRKQNYLVRSVKLKTGANTLEVLLNGKRIKKANFSNK